jgi:hypothetical protein
MRASHWWRPLAGVGIAAGVATVAIVALQQRAITPSGPGAGRITAQNVVALTTAATPNAAATRAAPNLAAQNAVAPAAGREALSYTVPASSDSPVHLVRARLTNYVFAHSQYSSGLGQRGVLADLLIDDEEPVPAAAQPPRIPDARVAP